MAATSSVDTQAVRFYTGTSNQTVSGKFCFFSLVNNDPTDGTGFTILIKPSSGSAAAASFEVAPGASFALPIIGKPYEGLYVLTNGAECSIVTDGKLS